MTIEIINGEFELFNDAKSQSVTITNDSMYQMYKSEYLADVRQEHFIGSFEEWVLDFDKCIEYLKSITSGL